MPDDSPLEKLTALAQRMPHQEGARRDAVSFNHFETELLRRAPGGRRTRALAPGMALAAAISIAFGAYAWLAPHRAVVEAPLRYEVRTTASAQSDAGLRQLTFSDGSRVELARQAELHVAELSPHGARVLLSRGSAEVAIAKREHAAWQFKAGPYTVHVTGTAFKLRWSEEREELEVAMHHGSVVVTGPLSPSGIALRAGQRLVAQVRTHGFRVEDLKSLEHHNGTEASLAASARPPASEASAARARPKAQPSQRPSATSAHDWEKRVAQGDFSGVLRAAQTLGYARVFASAGPEDLTALADAARYARKTNLGRDALLALRERFPHSKMGRHAAFFLGRLSEGASALAWYERYLREQPRGEYASQALGRSMMLYYEQGEPRRAATLAERYLARFPKGPYAVSARTLREPTRVPSTAP